MRQSQTTVNIFLLLLFHIFCQKTYLEKLSLQCYICISSFMWYVTGNAVIKHQRPYTYSILIYILRAVDCLFFYISEKYLLFRQKHLLGKMFGSPHTSNRIYLLQNCFSNCAYNKDMYITLKGIGKILFLSVLTSRLSSLKKLNFPNLHIIFRVRKLISV